MVKEPRAYKWSVGNLMMYYNKQGYAFTGRHVAYRSVQFNRMENAKNTFLMHNTKVTVDTEFLNNTVNDFDLLYKLVSSTQFLYLCPTQNK